MQRLRDLVDELLHAKVKATLFGPAEDHAPQLGRLRLLERLGAGAMGTVFAAYDPRLDRKVAVKVLRTNEASARVLAEARALARLAHPHVVAVHDADEVDGLVFIVMELAPGVPLRAWTSAPRDWRDVVRVLREAGAGIAAAHAAGLVHRDIKPDNILVGEDRTRVVDFGLANALGDDTTSAGTPFYMAPEVLAGAAATPASDQFSFGVTMYEALYGKRPYDVAAASSADTVPAEAYARARDELLAELQQAARCAGSALRPPGTHAPPWLHAIVTRALAAEPADRFASVAELVAALGRVRRRRTRLVAIAALGIAAGATASALAFQRTPGDPCSGGPARVAAVWNDDVRARVRVGLGDAPWTAQTIGAIDAHAERWQLGFRRVCAATRLHGEQSDTLLDLRMRCLDRALSRLDALARALASEADASARAAAPTAVGELPLTETCETMTSAAELAMPTDPAQRAKAVAVESELDRAWAAFVLGRYQDARPILAAGEAALEGVAAPRLRAAVLVLAASVEARIGDPQVARRRLDDALLAAAEAGAPELEYEVWTRRLRNELFAGDPAKVIEWSTFARAAAKRAGRDGAEVDGIVGEALRAAGKHDDARELFTRALASADPLRPEQRAVIEMNLGSVELATGNAAAALVTLGRARDRVLSAVGDRHPDLALYADKLAAAHRARGKLRDALRLHDQSLALRIAAFGASDRAIATALLYRAQTRLEAGELRDARADITRARQIRETVYGATSARLGEVVAVHGDVIAAGGARDEAAAYYDRAAELDRRLELSARRFAIGIPVELDAIAPLGPDETPSVERVAALAGRIELLAKAGRQHEASELAAALRNRFDPARDPALGYAIATAQLAAGDRAGAAELLAMLVPDLGNEPTRVALRIFVALARTSDTQAQAAARAAISLYQAMPQLDRADHDEMWAISRR